MARVAIMSKRIGSTPRKAAQDVCRVCQKDPKDKRQKHRLFTAAGCSAALPFHSSDPDPDARTSRDDLRPCITSYNNSFSASDWGRPSSDAPVDKLHA